MSHDPLILAYLAGIIDADGYVTIQRSVHAGRPYFGAKVGIAGTSDEPHQLASLLWGGKVSRYEPKNPAHKAQYQWSRSGKEAAAILASILPYLRIKRPHAELALRLQDHLSEMRSEDSFPWFGPDYQPLLDADLMFHEAKGLNVRQPRKGSATVNLESPNPDFLTKPEVIYVSLDGRIFEDADEAPPGSAAMALVGKKNAGRLLDGVEHNGMPAVRA